MAAVFGWCEEKSEKAGNDATSVEESSDLNFQVKEYTLREPTLTDVFVRMAALQEVGTMQDGV